MTKWQISGHVNPSKPTISWFIPAALVLCFAFPGCAGAQLAEAIDPVMWSVLAPATQTSTSLQSTRLCHAMYCNTAKSSPEAFWFQHWSCGVAGKGASWGGNANGFAEGGGPATDTCVGVPTGNPQFARRTSVAPGTIATSSAMPLKLTRKSAFSFEPDYLPSWITNQPLAYERYGAAPAVATLHFGHR